MTAGKSSAEPSVELVSPDEVAGRWKLRGREFDAIRDYADRHSLSVSAGKALVARIGLILAWAEHDDADSGEAPAPRRLLMRAVYHARHVLDDYGEPLERYEVLEPSIEEELRPVPSQTPDPSRLQALTVEQLKACATSPQMRALLWALEGGCDTLGEVDRRYDWTHGQARVVSSRLRRRMHALF